MNLAIRLIMNNDIIYYRRNLPHIYPEDAMFFITFLLAGAIPASVLKKLKKEKEYYIKMLRKKFNGKKFDKEIYKIKKIYIGQFDDFLDSKSTGPYWLEEEVIAQIVADKMHALDGVRYELIAYTIMSNHVHVLFNTTGVNESTKSNVSGKTKDYPVADTMRLLKGSTSRLCNLELGRNGAFWHHESYDHYVRDETELNRIIKYIVNNPVKAGLVDGWKNWKFTYLVGM